MTRIRTNEGRVTEVDPDFVQQCSVLRMVTDMTDCSDVFASFDEIPLPNINTAIMDTITKFFESNTLPEFTQPQEMFPLMMAADYLGYDTLLDESAKAVAESLKGRSAQEIRDVFGIETTIKENKTLK
jgi:Skp1 family, dimerisation domain